MSYVLEFEIHALPRMTNPSGRPTHWAVLAKETKQWKGMVAALVAGHKPPVPLKRAKLTLTRHSAVCPDADGLVSGFKRIIDGLREAGVLEDDKFVNVGMPEYRWEPAKRGKGKVTVRVAEATNG